MFATLNTIRLRQRSLPLANALALRQLPGISRYLMSFSVKPHRAVELRLAHPEAVAAA
jgi:hypothetical protein